MVDTTAAVPLQCEGSRMSDYSLLEVRPSTHQCWVRNKVVTCPETAHSLFCFPVIEDADRDETEHLECDFDKKPGNFMCFD